MMISAVSHPTNLLFCSVFDLIDIQILTERNDRGTSLWHGSGVHAGWPVTANVRNIPSCSPVIVQLTINSTYKFFSCRAAALTATAAAAIFALELICIKSKSGTKPVTDSQTKRRDKSRVESNAKVKASVTQRSRQSSPEREKSAALRSGPFTEKSFFSSGRKERISAATARRRRRQDAPCRQKM